MLKVKNNRLLYAGISFSLPDGMCINNTTEVIPENGICLESENGDFCMTISFNECDNTAENMLKAVLEDCGAAVLQSVSDIDINGQHGCCAIYTIKNNEYYELQLNPIDNCNVNCSVVILADSGKIGIKEILNRENIKKFFADIQKI